LKTNHQVSQDQQKISQ